MYRMEEQIERKATSTIPEEPIKAEGTVESPGTSERSDGSVSPPPNCSICLGKLVNTSFTDSCLHQFCFTCLLQWSKIKTECPLCKQTFKSIIHNVRSEEDYDQYHVPRELATQVSALDFNFDIVGNVGVVGVGAITGNWDYSSRRFMYRTTLGNPNRHMIINPHEVSRREQLPSHAHQLSRDERRRRQINPSDFRRNVYRHGVWANPLPDMFGSFRECSAEFYRRHPNEIQRLIPWLNRELQVLLNNNTSHVAYVLRIIIDSLTVHDIRSQEFKNLVAPYFGINTEHFIHEFANFARTSFDMVGYDQSVIYLPRGGISNEYVPRIISPVSSISSMASDDSDVRIVDDYVERRRGSETRFINSIPQSIDMPGPSTVGRAFHPYIPYVRDLIPDVVTVSSSSSDSDDCEVVGYVKPRHERTPEIIDLSNSETEEINLPSAELQTLLPPEDESQPSTSQDVKRQSVRNLEKIVPGRIFDIVSSSTYSESDSGSDYNPRRTHKPGRKNSRKASRSIQSRKGKRLTAAKRRTKTDRVSSGMCDTESDSKPLEQPLKQITRRRHMSFSSGCSFDKGKRRNTKSKSRKMKRAVSDPPKENKTSKRKLINSSSETGSSTSCESDIEDNQVQKNSRRSYSSSSSTTSSSERSRSSSKTKEKKKIPCRSKTRVSQFKDIRNESESSCDGGGGSMRTNDASKSFQYSCNLNSSEEDSISNKSTTDNFSDEASNKHDGSMLGLEEMGTEPSLNSLEQHRYYRSKSQCSVCSDNTHINKKKSKHKNKHKEKTTKLSSKFFSSLDVNSMSYNTLMGSKNEMPSTSKHSDPKDLKSRSRNKYRSHKKSKDSKRRRSRSNSRTKSRKKKVLRITSSADLKI